MNKAVDSWNRHEQSRKPDVPDVVHFDGVAVSVSEEVKVPKKKKDRVLESLAKDTVPDVVVPASVALTEYQFNSIIRQIKRNAEDRVAVLRATTHAALKRLKVPRDVTKAVAGPAPAGSDQGDAQSFVVWSKRIKADDEAAVVQLVAIDATATVRVKG